MTRLLWGKLFPAARLTPKNRGADAAPLRCLITDRASYKASQGKRADSRRPTNLLLSAGLMADLREATGNAILVRDRQLGVARQCENVARGGFRFGELTGSIAEVLEARLQVQRLRVVDRATNLVRLELLHHMIAQTVLNADTVLVEDVSSLGLNLGQLNRVQNGRLPEQLTVTLSIVLPRCGPFIEPSQFQSQHGGLQ